MPVKVEISINTVELEVKYLYNHLNTAAISLGAIHSTKIPTGPTGKRGPPQKVDPFFRNFSGRNEPIH